METVGIPDDINPLYHEHWSKLQARYKELRVDTESLHISTQGKIGSEGVEVASERYAKELAAVFATRDRNVLHLLLNALDRIRTPEYGQCENCGEAIDQKRLRAVPWAYLCIACQERSERENVSDHKPLAAYAPRANPRRLRDFPGMRTRGSYKDD